MDSKKFYVKGHKDVNIATGIINTEGRIFIRWRADIGMCNYEIYNLDDALRIAPTSKRIKFHDYQQKPENKSRWTGGHRSPRALPKQKNNIPTPNEQIEILDCSD